MPFIAYEVALDACRSLRSLIAKLRKRNPSLADQIQRASQSVALNLAEGSGRRGRDRTQHYRIAAGSAGEARGGLDIAVAFGDLDAAEIADAWSNLDRVVALLWPMTR